MSKKQAKTDGTMVQLSLPLSALPSRRYSAESFNTQAAIKEALTTAFRECGIPREVIAEELTRLTGSSISVHTVNNWTSEAKTERAIPLEVMAAVYALTGDASPIQAALQSVGLAVLTRKQQAYYELGRMAVEDKKRAKQRRALLDNLREGGGHD